MRIDVTGAGLFGFGGCRFDRARAFLRVQLLARLGSGFVGFADQLLLAGQPFFELAGRDGAYTGDHAGVTAAAEERALATEDARLFDLEPGVVVVAGDRLELAAE